MAAHSFFQSSTPPLGFFTQTTTIIIERKKVRAMAVSCGLVLRESCSARIGQVLHLRVPDSPNSVFFFAGRTSVEYVWRPWLL